MKAFVYHRYGTADNLRMAEVRTPVPKDDEVLIRIHAVSINGVVICLKVHLRRYGGVT